MKFYSIIFALIFSHAVSAQFGQEIDAEVISIVSPNSAVTYNTVDTFDVVVRIRNNGPNTLIAGDEFIVNYSIGDGSANSISVDTVILVGSNRTMQINEDRTYTLAKDFIINGNNLFSACASVSGTTRYPRNTNKSPEDCEQFFVSVKEQPVQINKVYYANNQILIKLNSATPLEVKLFDITGKLIQTRSNVIGKEISIPFAKKTKGFYFVTITDKNGNQSTAKFVVSQ
jgi:hypothetical protein